MPIVYKAQRTLLHSLIDSIGWAFVMITVVMMILLRTKRMQLLNVRGGLVSMIPNVLPVILIFGAMGHHGRAGGYRHDDDGQCGHGRGRRRHDSLPDLVPPRYSGRDGTRSGHSRGLQSRGGRHDADHDYRRARPVRLCAEHLHADAAISAP